MNTETRKIQTFRDLKVWQESHALVLMVYDITKDFPNREMFGLTSQMRRAAVSITSNIAEGFGRHTMKDKVQFYYVAGGSITELQNQLDICKDIHYINQTKYNDIIAQSEKAYMILNGLISSCRLRIIGKISTFALLLLLTSNFYLLTSSPASAAISTSPLGPANLNSGLAPLESYEQIWSNT